MVLVLSVFSSSIYVLIVNINPSLRSSNFIIKVKKMKVKTESLVYSVFMSFL